MVLGAIFNPINCTQKGFDLKWKVNCFRCPSIQNGKSLFRFSSTCI